MPCKKCKDEKYKWGNTGECEYPTKEACEKANSKYKKMKKIPSPINYKSYDDYKKAYNEYHNAQELNLSDAKKINLGIADDLEKLNNQGKDVLKDFEKIAQTDEDAYDKWQNRLEDRRSVAAGMESAGQRSQNAQNDLNKLKTEMDRAERLFKEWDDTYKKEEKAYNDINKEINKLESDSEKASAKARDKENEARLLGNKMKQEITTFEKLAKDLGVNISSKVNEYKKMANDLINAESLVY
jgi:uncharacterized phage infection (PIP) family protein YhgE